MFLRSQDFFSLTILEPRIYFEISGFSAISELQTFYNLKELFSEFSRLRKYSKISGLGTFFGKSCSIFICGWNYYHETDYYFRCYSCTLLATLFCFVHIYVAALIALNASNKPIIWENNLCMYMLFHAKNPVTFKLFLNTNKKFTYIRLF